MNATTFFLILIAAYLFYFTFTILMDAARFSKSAVQVASTKQDFVIPQVQHSPVKVTIAKSSDEEMPQLETLDDDQPDPIPKEKLKEGGSNFFDAMGIEIISEDDEFVVDAKALNFMLS